MVPALMISPVNVETVTDPPLLLKPAKPPTSMPVRPALMMPPAELMMSPEKVAIVIDPPPFAYPPTVIRHHYPPK